jgi:hypothetical protein
MFIDWRAGKTSNFSPLIRAVYCRFSPKFLPRNEWKMVEISGFEWIAKKQNHKNPFENQQLKWCGWRGATPRPLASEANTLSTELQPQTEGCIVGGFTKCGRYNRGLISTPPDIF